MTYRRTQQHEGSGERQERLAGLGVPARVRKVAVEQSLPVPVREEETEEESE